MTDATAINIKSRWQEWAVYCGLFLSTLDTGIVTVALKPIATVFGVSLPVVGLTVTFYLFALIAVLIPGGWLGDRFGSERTLAVGFALFGAASLVCGSAATISQLVGGRALQGIGAALIQGNALGYVAKQPPGRRLHMSTLMTAAISVGPILGPSLGGGLLELAGWPWLFLVNIPFCVVGFLIAWRSHDEEAALSDQRADFREFGAFLALIALAAWLLYAFDVERPTWQISTAAGLVVVVGVAFTAYERRRSFALIPVASITTRAGGFISIGAFVFGYTAGVFFAAAPVLLLRHPGSTLSLVGLITSAAPVGLLVGAMGRKAVGTGVGDLRAMQLGGVLMAVALALFAFAPASVEPVWFAVIAGLYGVGGGVFQVSNIKSAPKVSPERPATAGSLLRLFQNLGIALGATVALYLLQNSVALSANASDSSMVWGIAGAVVLLLLLISTLQRRQDYES